MRFNIFVLVTVMLAGTGCASLHALTFADDAGAIRGYDPVAYFTESRPTRGNSDISARHNGATFHFASNENRDLFLSDPDRYAPQYGGYCAYAMSKGFVVSTDPDAWAIHNEKLYLNYSLGVRKTWIKKKDEYIAKADPKWAKKLSNGIDS